MKVFAYANVGWVVRGRGAAEGLDPLHETAAMEIQAGAQVWGGDGRAGGVNHRKWSWKTKRGGGRVQQKQGTNLRLDCSAEADGGERLSREPVGNVSATGGNEEPD